MPRKGTTLSSVHGSFADRTAQRVSELARLPALIGRVLPELARARLSATESFVDLLAAQAKVRPAAPAMLIEGRTLRFLELERRVSLTAGWLHERGLRSGDVLALQGVNSLDGVSLLLGASRLGARVALVGTGTGEAFLDQALARLAPSLLLVEAGGKTRSRTFQTLEHGGAEFEQALGTVSSRSEGAAFARRSADDDFVYIYTSGTTGPMKAASVIHRRAFSAATIFGRLVHRTGPGDVVYCALPLNHASGLLLGLGACLATGSALALRRRFSARALLDDVRSCGATVLLYVGELPRALLALPEAPNDRQHSLRLAVGNGLSPEIWGRFQERFAIPEIREFYAATEFPGAIVNLSGKVGSVGHIPLERARGYRLVRVDAETGALLRDARGRVLACDADQPGELVLRLRSRPGHATGDYRGFLSEPSDESRIARDLFRIGDVYCRSGDLLRRDQAGNYWFVDRLGDSFRFKGENVSSHEVEMALATLPGVNAVAVVGVRVPGIDGQPPLAVVASRVGLEFRAFEAGVARLPNHARPCFLRLVTELPFTESQKVKKRELARLGVDPERVEGPLYFRNGARYEPLTPLIFRSLVAGQVRL